MDCHEFQRYHPELLDDSLSAADTTRVRAHMCECTKCADQDAMLRRALLLFRNLSPIEPSRNFAEQLKRRLAEARSLGPARERARRPMLAFTAVAASLAFTAILLDSAERSTPALTLPPVLAVSPEPAATSFVSPAIAASMSVGFPVWPTLLMAEHASQSVAEAEFRFASLTHNRE
jgi:hypothetical protein